MSTVIHTKRLVLREFCGGDASRVAALAVSRLLTHVQPPYTREDALSFFAGRANTDKTLAVTIAGAIIGCCGLDKELGYWFGKEFWGGGYATEATKALINRHFQKATDAVKSGYLLGNAPSERVLENLRFEKRHVEEVCSAALDETVHVQKMSLARASWEGRA